MRKYTRRRKSVEELLKSVNLQNHRELYRAARLDRRAQHRVLSERLQGKVVCRRLARVLEGKTDKADWTKFGIPNTASIPEYTWVSRKRKRQYLTGYTEFRGVEACKRFDASPLVTIMFEGEEPYHPTTFDGIGYLPLLDTATPGELWNVRAVLLQEQQSEIGLREQDEARQFHRYRDNAATKWSTNRRLSEATTALSPWDAALYPKVWWRWMRPDPDLHKLRESPYSAEEALHFARIRWLRARRLAKVAKASMPKFADFLPNGLYPLADANGKWSVVRVTRPIIKFTVVPSGRVIRYKARTPSGSKYIPQLRIRAEVVRTETKQFRLRGSCVGASIAQNWLTPPDRTVFGAQRWASRKDIWKDMDEVDKARRRVDAYLRIIELKPDHPNFEGEFRALCELKDTGQTIACLKRLSRLVAVLPKILKAMPKRARATATLVEIGAAYLLYMFGIKPTVDDAGKYTPAFVKQVKEYFCPTDELVLTPAWPEFLGAGENVSSAWSDTLRMKNARWADDPFQIGTVKSEPLGAGIGLPTSGHIPVDEGGREAAPGWMFCLQRLSESLNRHVYKGRQSSLFSVSNDESVYARLLSQVDTKDLERAMSFTAHNHLAETAWQLTPWTFLIDWFWDVSKSIARLDRFAFNVSNRQYFDRPWLSARVGVHETTVLPKEIKVDFPNAPVGQVWEFDISTEWARRSTTGLAHSYEQTLNNGDVCEMFWMDTTAPFPFSEAPGAETPEDALSNWREAHGPLFLLSNSYVASVSRAPRPVLPGSSPAWSYTVLRSDDLAVPLQARTAISGRSIVVSAARQHTYERRPLEPPSFKELLPTWKGTLSGVQMALGIALALTNVGMLCRQIGIKPKSLVGFKVKPKTGPASAGKPVTTRGAWSQHQSSRTTWSCEWHPVVREHQVHGTKLRDFLNVDKRLKQPAASVLLDKWGWVGKEELAEFEMLN